MSEDYLFYADCDNCFKSFSNKRGRELFESEAILKENLLEEDWTIKETNLGIKFICPDCKSSPVVENDE